MKIFNLLALGFFVWSSIYSNEVAADLKENNTIAVSSHIGTYNFKKNFKKTENAIVKLEKVITDLKKTITNLANKEKSEKLKNDLYNKQENLYKLRGSIEIDIIAENIDILPDEEQKARTGSLGFYHLKKSKVQGYIAGHSEARNYLGATDQSVNQTLKSGLDNNFKNNVICIGESKEIRYPLKHLGIIGKVLKTSIFPFLYIKNNILGYKSKHVKYVLAQLKQIFKDIDLNEKNADNVIIAYEPLWAIGSGKTPTVNEIQEMLKAIRDWLSETYTKDIADKIRILYGGSVNSQNADDLCKSDDLDGFLIGGAGKKADNLLSIAKTLIQNKNKNNRTPILSVNLKAYLHDELYKYPLELSKLNQYIEELKAIKPSYSYKKPQIIISAPNTEIIPLIKTVKTLHDEQKIKFKEDPYFKLIVQNIDTIKDGAYTGQTSLNQAKPYKRTILNHSERIKYAKETNKNAHKKLRACLDNDFEQIVVAIGESKEIRYPDKENPKKENEDNAIENVKKQLGIILKDVTSKELEKIVLGYEPRWAIGTGKKAENNQIENMHTAIRKWLTEKYTKEIANKIRIIYGGSANKDNAGKIIKLKNVDGLFVGSKSTNIEQVQGMLEAIKNNYIYFTSERIPIFIGNFKAYQIEKIDAHVKKLKDLSSDINAEPANRLSTIPKNIEIFIAPQTIELALCREALSESA